MSKTFRDKLTRLLLETTKGESLESGLPAETAGEIVNAVADQLGKFIALQCGGDQGNISKFLDMAAQQMHECAADTQKAGQFLADPANWFTVSSDGTVRTPVIAKKVTYDQSHWYNQEIARAGVRLLMERPTQPINGVEMLSGKYDPEMIGMVAATLSEALGKMVVLICSQHPDLIDKILEGATHNAFEVAAKFKASVVEIKPDEIKPDGERL